MLPTQIAGHHEEERVEKEGNRGRRTARCWERRTLVINTGNILTTQTFARQQRAAPRQEDGIRLMVSCQLRSIVDRLENRAHSRELDVLHDDGVQEGGVKDEILTIKATNECND